MNVQTQALLQSKTTNGQWFVLAAAVLWGTTGTAQAFAPEGFNPLVIGTLRMIIGGVSLSLFAALRGELHHIKSLPRLSVIGAAFGIAAYQLCFFAGVAKTGVAVGTMVAIGSSPIFAGFFGWLVRKENPGKKWIFSTGLAILGCGLLLSSGGEIYINTTGIVLALGAGAAYAIAALFSKGMLEDHSPDVVITRFVRAEKILPGDISHAIETDAAHKHFEPRAQFQIFIHDRDDAHFQCGRHSNVLFVNTFMVPAHTSLIQ